MFARLLAGAALAAVAYHLGKRAGRQELGPAHRPRSSVGARLGAQQRPPREPHEEMPIEAPEPPEVTHGRT